MMTAARARLAVVALDSSLIEAALHLNAGADLAVVCDCDAKLAGLLTKTDIVDQVILGRDVGTSLASVMVSRDIVLARPGDKLADVWALMKTRGIKNVPIVNAEDRPIAVLSANDALQSLLDEAENEDLSLRNYVMGVGYR